MNDNLELLSVPIALLSKLYDRTGTTNGGNKGFFISFVNAEGVPVSVSQFENEATRIAIQKSVEDLMKGNTNLTIEDILAEEEGGDAAL